MTHLIILIFAAALFLFSATFLIRKYATRKRSLKTIGLQLALLTAILLSRVTFLFFHDYRLLVFEKKDQSSWINLAEGAQGDLYACRQDLETAKEEKQAAVAAGNQDIMNGLK